MMSGFLVKLVNLFKAALLRVRNIKDLKRLLKWAVGISMVVFWYFKIKTKPHDNIVTLPDCHPLFGHFVSTIKHFEDMNEYLYGLVKEADFPPCAAITSYRQLYCIVILDPEIAKCVFDTKFESFMKGDRISMELEEMLGDGIFTSDPPQWKFHRKSYVFVNKTKICTNELI